jgi:uncharacterized protein (TIGR02145 family)
MKKIIICCAIATMLFACSKNQLEQVEQVEQESSFKKGGNGGKGGKGGKGSGGGGLTVTTDEASYILSFGATSGGSVSSSGGGKNVTERGVCYSISSNPTIADFTVPSGSGSGTFTSILTGLNDNTTYYTRAYANKTKNGNTTTTYGNQVTFTTPEAIYGTVTDIDGNTYTTIEIGTQVWMMENLKTTTYSDGTPIPNVTDELSWGGLSSGAYCNFGNNVNNVAEYGRLYNWYAIDDSRNIAMAGWHVATTAEWNTLVDYVGGGALYFAGAKLKEAGFVHWDTPSVSGNEGNNSSGLTAVGGGERTIYTSSAPFTRMKRRGSWWTATGSAGNYADFVYLQSTTTAIMGSGFGATGFDNFDKRCGYSVRLVKD